MKRFLNQAYEAMVEAIDIMRSNKTRSALVIIGVMIGVASLMGMVSTVAGLDKFIRATMSAADTPIVSLTRLDITKGESFSEMQKRPVFEVDDAQAIARLPHIRGVAIQYARNMVVKYKDRKTNFISVLGSNQELLEIQSMVMAEGRYFTREEENRNHKLVVLGDQTRKSLFPSEDPLGKKIRIQGKEYTIIGALESRKTFMGSFAENFVVIPYGAYERDFLAKFDDLQLHAIVDNIANLEAAKDDMRALMRMRRKVPIGEPDDFALVTVDAMIEFTSNITDRIALVLVVLASIALMIGGIGVMVIMLVSVTERTHEIGIRKAIGATRRQITMQFLIEAGTLSGVGGLVGILVGLLIAWGISILLGFPFTVPLGWTIFAVLISAGVGLFFGIFPAQKAARMDPIEALRYE